MRVLSVKGIFETAATTPSISAMTRPAQSPEMRSTTGCPNVVDPLGFGAATTQPCPAHSDGFQRVDQASPHTPWGPPCIRKTTGYFFAGSKLGGLISQYWTGPPAAFTVMPSGWVKATLLTHASLARVSGFRPLPSIPTRNTSGGATSEDIENTTKSRPAWIDPTLPPCSTRFGSPPAAGTVYRLVRAFSPAAI